jgi:hypothetical protein
MQIIKTLLIIVIISTCGFLLAQDKKNNNFGIFSPENIQLRNSFQSQALSSKPAEFIYTFPKDEKEHYLINAALGYRIKRYHNDSCSSNLFDLNISPIIEYHRNNFYKTQQNHIQAGIFIDWQLKDIKTCKFTPFVNSKLSYNYDIYNEIKSLFFSSYFSFEFTNNNFLKYVLPQDEQPDIFKIISYAYSPQIGIEYSNKIDVKEGYTKGSNTAAYGRFLINVYPLYKELSRRLEIQTDYNYRYNFINNSNIYSNHIKLLILSFNFVLVKSDNRMIKLGVDYTKGDDPTSSAYNQDVWNLVFKIKL